MMTPQGQEQLLQEWGLWAGARRETHSFLLSPDAYEITSAQAVELEELARTIHESLGGAGRMAAIATNPTLCRGKTWGMIRRALFAGVPQDYQGLELLEPGQVPVPIKVDLMERIDGSYAIAEIDGHNTHGLGYSGLLALMTQLGHPDAKHYPGVAAALKTELHRRGESRLTFLYGDRERFYLPEFEILARTLKSEGVDLTVVSEIEVAGELPAGLLVGLPFLYRNQDLRQSLVRGYREGKYRFLIPPKPFLGSKALLALLRNEENDQELEAILRSQILARSLEVVRRCTPKTHLIIKQGRDSETYWAARRNGSRCVLKECISSGMKGTVFSDEAEFGSVWHRACASHYQFVMQEEVETRRRRLSYFEADGQLKSADWHLRVIVHFSQAKVADVIVTARQDKAVHGAKDCLFLGGVLV